MTFLIANLCLAAASTALAVVTWRLAERIKATLRDTPPRDPT
jgi:hypothetical protein